MQNRITAAVIRHNGYLWPGLRHAWIRDAIWDFYGEKIRINFQLDSGFVDIHGNFLNREQARELALQCGQVREEDLQTKNELFSEDLW